MGMGGGAPTRGRALPCTEARLQPCATSYIRPARSTAPVYGAAGRDVARRGDGTTLRVQPQCYREVGRKKPLCVLCSRRAASAFQRHSKDVTCVL